MEQCISKYQNSGNHLKNSSKKENESKNKIVISSKSLPSDCFISAAIAVSKNIAVQKAKTVKWKMNWQQLKLISKRTKLEQNVSSKEKMPLKQ